MYRISSRGPGGVNIVLYGMENKQSILTRFFRQGIHHKQDILRGFYMLYAFLMGLWILFAYWTSQNVNRAAVYEVGIMSGQIALITFCAVITPGILRRFGIRNMMTSFLMVIRRHLGITMFSLAFLHYSSIRLLPILFGGAPLIVPPPLFEFMGVAALYTLAPVFITSNDLSVSKLGPWWRRIHSMVYFIVWLLFLHVAFQDIGIWTFLIGFFAVAETASLIYVAVAGNTQKAV